MAHRHFEGLICSIRHALFPVLNLAVVVIFILLASQKKKLWLTLSRSEA